MTTTSVTSEPTNLDESSKMDNLQENPIPCMQSVNNYVMRHIFSYLGTKDLGIASRVCTTWNTISKDKILWRHVQLKEVMVYDWDKFIDIIIQKGSTTLDCRDMLVPLESQDFWTHFISAIKKTTKLQNLALYGCPTRVVQECMIALPQLSRFSAFSITRFNELIASGAGFIGLDLPKNPIILNSVNQMVNLTELKLKTFSGIDLLPSTSFLTFENLTKLRILSLTSMKSCPQSFCRSLETVTTSLEHLEIGDCDIIFNDLPTLIKRFTNLKFLRLEQVCGDKPDFTKKLLVEIGSLKKLKVLELININLDNGAYEKLGNCTGVDNLLLIPQYMNNNAETNLHVIECLKKLSKTLKYFIWGITTELFKVTDIFITQYNLYRLSSDKMPYTFQSCSNPNRIPIFKDIVDDDHFDIITISDLEKLLKSILVETNTTVIGVPLSETTHISFENAIKP